MRVGVFSHLLFGSAAEDRTSSGSEQRERHLCCPSRSICRRLWRRRRQFDGPETKDGSAGDGQWSGNGEAATRCSQQVAVARRQKREDKKNEVRVSRQGQSALVAVLEF